MVLEKRQKVFIAVFFLGLIALVVDRVCLRPEGGPKHASASAFEQYGVPVSTADPVPEPPGTRNPTVAERLDRLWSDQDVNEGSMRDPFSLTGSWQVSPPVDAPPAPDEAAVFAETHPLVAVVMAGQQSYVLINDRVLPLGEQIDGFTLVSVGAKSAVFERQGKQIVLELVSK
jgi:hypothetical protein